MQVVLDFMDVMQSSGKPTMNMVVLGVIDIENSLKQLEDDAFLLDESDATEFKQEIARCLRECVSSRMRPFTKIELVAALLDPELKGIPKIRRSIPGEDASSFLHECIEEYLPGRLTENEEEIQIITEPAPKKLRSSLIAKYSASRSPFESLSSEVELYLASPITLGGEDQVLTWWSSNAKLYPSLSKLARIVLSIPATSAEPERRFSAAGNALREKRSQLSPMTMAKSLFIHDNKKFLPKI